MTMWQKTIPKLAMGVAAVGLVAVAPATEKYKIPIQVTAGGTAAGVAADEVLDGAHAA